MAGTHRAHILIPGDLLREIDGLVGPRGRSAFLLETARQEVQRRKLLRFLENEDPAWSAQDHPELAGGAAAWVRQLRQQSERRVDGETGSSRVRKPRTGMTGRSANKPRRSK
jgi:hypothetical protein